ncbi:hypothetical protein LBMAG53_12230 [Planctomycetota bacterium]|nr:hypothetical protein LBMAG53_12230 [Planctomycetota bacterium]
MIGLRRAADVESLLTIAVTIGALAVTAGGLCRHPGLYVLSVLGCYRCCVINHNHQHLPIMVGSAANQVLTVLLSAVIGLPGSVLIPLHNRNHHQANNRPDDAMSTAHLRLRRAWLRLFAYPLVAAVRWAPRRRALLARLAVDEPWLHRRIRVEQIAILVALLAAILAGGWQGAVALLLPWTLAQYWVVNANYIQHHGCDSDDPDACVRTFTGRLLNWFTMNGGYHLVHHQRPEIHWRDLAAMHEARVPAAAPHQVEPSMPAWLWRHLTGRAP